MEATLQRVGIRRHFDVVVASGEVGYAKPHPQIFRIAAERLQVAPQDLLYVGDSIEHDIDGAAAAGMDAVLLDRGGRQKAHQPRIAALTERQALLEGG